MIQADIFTSLELLDKPPVDAPKGANPDDLWFRLTFAQPEIQGHIEITMSAQAMMEMLAGLVVDLNRIVRQQRGDKNGPDMN